MKTTAALTFLTTVLPTAASTAAPMHSIVINGQLAGSTQSAHWVDMSVTAKHLKGGEKYKIYGFDTQIGTGVGSKPGPPADHCPEVPTVDLADAPIDYVIAIDAAGGAAPRKPRIESVRQPVYQKIVADYVRAQGLRRSKVDVTQILRADLDGKGVDSTIITATYTAPWPEYHTTARFDIVLLRRIVHGKVVTVSLVGDVAHQADAYRYPRECTVKGLYDLKGDGKLEIVIETHYQDSMMSYIFDVKGSKAKNVLTTGCSV